MTTFQKRALLTAVIAGFAVIGYLMNSQQAVAQGPPNGLAVNIVNPVPLPVTGATTVSGTVAATQSGNWNVGINGTAAVKDTENPARHFVSFEFAPGYAPSYTVPTGKILVIEWVSASPTTPMGLSADGDFDTASNTHRWTAIFPAVKGF